MQHEEHELGIGQAAIISGVSRQAVYVAITKGCLKASKDEKTRRWLIKYCDLIQYRKERYSRKYSRDAQGDLFYNPSEGIFSPVQVARMFAIPVQRVYYLLRSGNLGVVRKEGRQVILQKHIDDCSVLSVVQENLNDRN